MDNTIELKIKDICLTEMSREEGAVFRTLITQLWSQCSEIILDFADIDFLSISFLDEAIGKIFLEKPSDEVFTKLKIRNLSDSGSSTLKSIASARVRQFQDQKVVVSEY